jgi:type I restriction enzyme S subunit
MKDEKKAPKLRFKGFTDDWEQCKLGDVAKITMGQSPNSKNYTDNPKDHILVQGNADMKDGQVHPRIWTTEITKIADKGDLILSVRAPVGDIGKTSYDVVIGRGVAAIKGNEFIFQLLKRMKAVGYWTKYSTGSTFESINSLEINNAVINLPKEHEQNEVGKILSYMDHAITLHEEKKQQLKCLKSALLQKMFANKNKSGDPDVRFKGFDERWERHILNDLAIFNPKGTLPTSFEYVDLGSVIGVEMISHKTISKFDAPSRAQRLAQVGDLFYQTVRPYQQNNYLFDNKDNAYVFSTGYAQLRPLIDGYFLLCLVQTKSFVRKVMNACTGTSYPAINSQDLAQIGVNIPINSKEQRLIGNLYKVIDNLITPYQQKLDDLNTIKQSLLQKMFI